MTHTDLVNAFFKASEKDRLEFLKIINQFHKDNNRPPLSEGLESFVVNESIRKSQTINFAPMQGGCPVCGK